MPQAVAKVAEIAAAAQQSMAKFESDEYIPETLGFASCPFNYELKKRKLPSPSRMIFVVLRSANVNDH